MIQASERAKECHWRSYLCHCSLVIQIGPDDEGGGFVDYIGCNRIVQFLGTGVLLLPSNEVDRQRDDRVSLLFRVALVVLGSAMEEAALRNNLHSTMGTRWFLVRSGTGSKDLSRPISNLYSCRRACCNL